MGNVKTYSAKTLVTSQEIRSLVTYWLIWFSLATRDIRLRYRRSVIGPFWITISTAVTISSIGILYGHLFHVELGQYLPYLASGIIVWSLISRIILESSNVFIESEQFLKNQESFVSIFMMRLVIRNIIIFAHDIMVFIPIMIIFHISIGFHTLLIIPNLLIISCNAIFWGSILGIIGTRYRDFSQIVGSFMQIAFFLTPIVWMPNALKAHQQWLVDYNPFNAFMNLIRYPLINKAMPTVGMLSVIVFTVIGFLLYSVFLEKYKHRIIFWI